MCCGRRKTFLGSLFFGRALCFFGELRFETRYARTSTPTEHRVVFGRCRVRVGGVRLVALPRTVVLVVPASRSMSNAN